MASDRPDPLYGAAEIGAWMRDGEAEFYDARTPRDALLAAESEADLEADRSPAMDGAMAYLFSAGPHPARVMQRLYLLVRELEPELLRTLPTGEVERLVSPLRIAHEWRVAALLRGTRVSRRPVFRHEEVINVTLRAANVRLRSHRRLKPVELADLLGERHHEGLAEQEERLAAIVACLRFFFFEGPAPEATTVRVFVIAKAQFPTLILDMGVRQLGALFGVTGAAWSERIKQKFNRFLDARNVQGVKARFQKSDSACEAYAVAQRGNRNRRGGGASIRDHTRGKGGEAGPACAPVNFPNQQRKKP